MITTVTNKNLAPIPAELGALYGILPGQALDWQAVPGKDEMIVRVVRKRGDVARQLLGAGEKYCPGVDSVEGLRESRVSQSSFEERRTAALARLQQGYPLGNKPLTREEANAR